MNAVRCVTAETAAPTSTAIEGRSIPPVDFNRNGTATTYINQTSVAATRQAIHVRPSLDGVGGGRRDGQNQRARANRRHRRDHREEQSHAGSIVELPQRAHEEPDGERHRGREITPTHPLRPRLLEVRRERQRGDRQHEQVNVRVPNRKVRHADADVRRDELLERERIVREQTVDSGREKKYGGARAPGRRARGGESSALSVSSPQESRRGLPTRLEQERRLPLAPRAVGMPRPAPPCKCRRCLVI